MLKTRDGQEIVHIYPHQNAIVVAKSNGYPKMLNKDTPDKTAVMSIPSRCTVLYIGLSGQVFVQPNVLYYEMNEAFSELSRQAYEAGTSLNYIVVS